MHADPATERLFNRGSFESAIQKNKPLGFAAGRVIVDVRSLMESRDEITEDSVPIAAEDKFLLFSFGTAKSLCPHAEHSARIAELVHRLRSPLDRLTPLFDLRGLSGYYNDIDDFIRIVGGDGSYVLLGEEQTENGWKEATLRLGLVPVTTRGQASTTTVLNFDQFDPEAEAYDDPYWYKDYGDVYKDESEYRESCQQDDFQHFMQSIHHNSLLVEFTMSMVHGDIQVAPYHAHAIHDVETPRDEVLVGRPAVVAATTGAVLSSEINAFERLLNDPETQERHIQSFLEQNPNFLSGLNYQNIYPQIILERDDDGPLKPDFILEPFDDAFCDILDIKLPTQKLFVHRKNRDGLAAGLHEVAAQLREYSAYFEQAKYRKMVADKYGLRLYRPRLIAIVGRDMQQMKEPEFRRALTAYENLQFMTFDELVKHAKRRILI